MMNLRSFALASRGGRPAAFFVLGATLLLAACGARRGPQVAPTADELYQRGATAYEAGQYARAIEHFSSFTIAHLGDARVPEAQYLLGRANMARRQYITAIGEFQRLITEYPAHPRGDGARFGICESYYRLSPRVQLDQEYTRAAVLHCEAYATYYPQSPQAGEALAWVGEMNDKLARKLYDNGMFYFRRRALDAAVIYFTQAVDQYPQSTVAPAALSMLVEAYTRIGYVEDAEAARTRLEREYPQSAEARALQG